MNRKLAGSRPMRSHSSSTQPTCSTNFSTGAFAKIPSARRAARRMAGSAPPPIEHRDRRRRRGPDGERREVEDGALVAERLAAPRLREDPQDLVHGHTATARVGTEARELHSGPPEPEAEDQPAVAEKLDRRRILGQAERVVQRREDDACAELDPRRRLGERSADDEERGHVAVIDEVVLGRPDGSEAEPLRLDRQPHRLVVGTRPVGLARSELCAEESEAESHGRRR